MIVVELNVFDGLSHNTASVMEKVLKEEYQDRIKKTPDTKTSYEEELKAVKNIMDAKELSKHVDVFSEIEDELRGGGYLGAYKDYATKLRNAPEYVKQDYANKVKELFKIRIRKEMLPIVSQLNILKDDFRRELSGLKDDELADEVEIGHLSNRFSQLIWDTTIAANKVGKDPRFENNELLKSFLENLKKIVDMRQLKKIALDDEIYVSEAKKIYDMISSTVYFLDSI
jgi:hypothetical protein